MPVTSSKALAALAVWTGAVVLSAAAPAADPAFTGMQVQGNSEAIADALDLPDDAGALVRDVVLNGPAGLAGIERGDLITDFGGKPVDSFETLLALVGQVQAGETVEIKVLRAGQELTMSLHTMVRPPAWSISAGAIAVVPSVGLTLAALTDRMRQRFRLRWSTVGVVISSIDRERLDSRELNEGDVIVKVNQHDIWDPEQVVQYLNTAKDQGKEGLLLLVEGQEGFRLLMLPVR